MAPPGGIPQGLYDKVPPSYQNKLPVPPEFDTNTWAYVFFFSYFGTLVALSLFVIQKLLRSYVALNKSTTARPPPRKHVIFFSILATSSLLTIGYYTIRYFQVSYQNWLMWRSYWQLDPAFNHWGLWLKETRVFREAWEIAIVGNARYWWTHQLFFFASGLSLMLEQRGPRRGIRHIWVFMVLGQLVAYSFATNLFILSLLLSPPPIAAPASSGIRRQKWLGPWIVNFIAIIATEWCALLLSDQLYWHSKDFVPVLTIPHCVLLVLPLASSVLPTKYFTDDDVEFAGTVYKYLWVTTIIGGSLVWLKVTSAAYGYSGVYGIWTEVTDHPAVSMVAFDVIFCWLSWASWWVLQRRGLNAVLEPHKKSDEYEWENAASITSATGGDFTSTMRRR